MRSRAGRPRRANPSCPDRRREPTGARIKRMPSYFVGAHERFDPLPSVPSAPHTSPKYPFRTLISPGLPGYSAGSECRRAHGVPTVQEGSNRSPKICRAFRIELRGIENALEAGRTHPRLAPFDPLPLAAAPRRTPWLPETGQYDSTVETRPQERAATSQEWWRSERTSRCGQRTS